MTWKLWTQNENFRPVEPQATHYEWEENALQGACAYIGHSVHVKVLYIEKPDGRRIELDAIKRWCDAMNPIGPTPLAMMIDDRL